MKMCVDFTDEEIGMIFWRFIKLCKNGELYRLVGLIQ